MNAYATVCQEVAYFMRRLYRQRLTTTSGGNISVRLPDQRVAITPSSLDKGRLTGRQILIMGRDGVNHTPALKPSIESGMHLAIYEARPDVQAIVHAHPVTATAFSVSGQAIRCELIAESYAMVHHVARAPYALIGTADLAGRVAAEARTADVVLMQNHGVVALGQTLLQAFDRLELVEAAAQMTLITRQLGDAAPLRDEWQRDLDGLMGRPRLTTNA